jgi:hypothetical protein
MDDDDWYHDGYSRYDGYGRYSDDIEYGGGGGYNSDSSNGASNRKAQKEKEIKANIPARALMLEELFYSELYLPQLPSAICSIIAEYEGGVESSVLGDNVASTWSWCNIL